MRKYALALVFSFAFLMGATAQAQTWVATGLTSTGCNSGNLRLTTVLSGVTFPTTLHFHTLVDAGGTRYMDEDAGTPGTNGPYPWSLYYSNSGGPATNAWPIPPGIPITLTLELINGPGGPMVTRQVYTITQCDGGVITAAAAASAVPTLPLPALALFGALLAGGAVMLLRRPA